jgi:hypothetical protein
LALQANPLVLWPFSPSIYTREDGEGPQGSRKGKGVPGAQDQPEHLAAPPKEGWLKLPGPEKGPGLLAEAMPENSLTKGDCSTPVSAASYLGPASGSPVV